jgi:putative transposase
VSEAKQLKALEDENSRLKKIVADLTLDRGMLQDVIRRTEGPREAAKL